MSIEFLGVSKKYANSSIIFDKANLKIDDNSFVALVGKSGSGKSTLLNLLSGLDRPDYGDVRINSQSILSMDDNALSTLRNRYMGFIFQFFYLQPFLSVVENIEVAAYPNGAMSKDERKNRATHLLSAVGLRDKTKSLPMTLSGGETQRVAIARALMNGPAIILADEPTGNLDAENSANIIKILRAIQKKTKCIMIVVTHDLNISRYADRVIGIREGKLVDEI